ncbi:MAG: hypothetical protein LBJ61_12225 [Deltaproteobacteria bacterium]|jgi:hypothetical protein|nr:hypothetical protein [Deltaproteobacteria bacterium]
MIAELHGKISKNAAKLHDRLEDQLTGDFFGVLRYVPFNEGMKKILLETEMPGENDNTIHTDISSIDAYEWSQNIEFWPRIQSTEPDVIIKIADIMILIEVKLDSGLSSDDDTDYAKALEEENKTNANQLDREARTLLEKSEDLRPILILLAPAKSAYSIYKDVCERRLPSLKKVSFGLLTWEKVLESIANINCDDPFKRVIFTDLKLLLQRKGFERFKSFLVGDIVEPSYWTFSVNFSFTDNSFIQKGVYYEFG